MDSAMIAALGTALGAAIGAGSTVGMGLLSSRTSRQQAELQARMQLREPRRDAYAEFIRAYLGLQKTLYLAHSNHEAGASVEILTSAIDSHQDETLAAYSRVALEGPDEVAVAADAVVDAVTNVWHTTVVYSQTISQEEGPMAIAVLERIPASLAEFTLVARAAVDIRP